MIWDSFVEGLGIFAYWETYVGLAIYTIVTFIVGLILFGLIYGGRDKPIGTLGQSIVHILCVGFFVFFMLAMHPIFLGVGEDILWLFPFQAVFTAPLFFLALFGVLVVVAVVFSLIPLVNSLGVVFWLVKGAIILFAIFTWGYASIEVPVVSLESVEWVPGFSLSAGIVFVAALLSLLTFAYSLVFNLAAANDDTGEMRDNFILIGMGTFPLGVILSVIPITMYGHWVGAQLAGG